MRAQASSISAVTGTTVLSGPQWLWAIAMVASLAALSPDARAQRAWLVLDTASGMVSHAHNANLLSYPASLTKMMTAYVALAAIEGGEISFEDEITVSAHAASQVGSRLGLNAGDTLTVKEALFATIVRSGNDSAVALAEAVAGSETRFVARMNARAAEFDMRRTRFSNASGLPNLRQVTTARDMALLALALQMSMPQHYHLFSTRSVKVRGQAINTHNRFITSFRGGDGLKTGFTCRAGYNLAASARRGDRRLVGIVLGATSNGARIARMTRLLEAAFKRPEEMLTDIVSLADLPDQGEGQAANRESIARACTGTGTTSDPLFRASNWSLEFSIAADRRDAASAAGRFISKYRAQLRGGRPFLVPKAARKVIYRVGVTGLSQRAATKACLEVRKTSQPFCVVMSPETSALAIRSGKLALTARGGGG